jgi:hypothetical protein
MVIIKVLIDMLIAETTATNIHNCANEPSNLKIDPILEQAIEEDPFFSAPIHLNQIMAANTTNKI